MFVCFSRYIVISFCFFPDSTLRGNGELGDNNKVQVTQVLYLLDRENNRREAVVGLGECV